LKEKGFKKLKLQIGRGTEPTIADCNDVAVEWFRLKDNITTDILSSSLVISHAGAGSCLEVLEMKKPLIVVINTSLMNNHQLELAGKLDRQHHARMCEPEALVSAFSEWDTFSSIPFPECQVNLFPNYIERLMGHSLIVQ